MSDAVVTNVVKTNVVAATHAIKRNESSNAISKTFFRLYQTARYAVRTMPASESSVGVYYRFFKQARAHLKKPPMQGANRIGG